MARSTNIPLVDKAFELAKKDLDTKLSRLSGAVPMIFGATTVGTSSSDRFMLPFEPGTAISSTEVSMPVYRGGVLQPFVVRIETVGGAAADRRVEIAVRVNGVDTPMRVHFTCPKFTGILRASDRISVKKDDLVSVVVRKDGALTTAPDVSPLYMEVTP